MRINEVITLKQDHNSDRLVKFILKNCKPYLEQTLGVSENAKPLYRGVKGSYSNKAFISKPRLDRKPMSTSVYTTELINAAFKNAGFVANRTNSFFTSGNDGQAGSYGRTYVVYPIGDFTCTWSPDVRDMFVASSRFFTSDIIKVDFPKLISMPYKTEDGGIFRIFKNIMYNLTRELKDAVIDVIEDRMGYIYSTDENLDIEKFIRLLRQHYPKYNAPKIVKYINSIMTSYNDVFKIVSVIMEDHSTTLEVLKTMFSVQTEVLLSYIKTKQVNSLIFEYISEDNSMANLYKHIIQIDMETLTNKISNLYNKDNIYSAIESGNEIMITGKKFLFVPVTLNERIGYKITKEYHENR